MLTDYEIRVDGISREITLDFDKVLEFDTSIKEGKIRIRVKMTYNTDFKLEEFLKDKDARRS